MQEQGLRFGIMCDSLVFDAWQAKCLDQLIRAGAQPVLIIENHGVSGEKSAPRWSGHLLDIYQALSSGHFLWLLYGRLFTKFASRSRRPVSMEERLGGVRRIFCTVVRKGKFSDYFQESDLEQIRASDLDFIIRFAFNIIRGDILKAARYGVWSFHHGDEREYRGRPAGFWEIFERNPCTGAILQRLTDKLDGGVILHRGVIQTEPNYAQNLDNIFFTSAGWAARVCRQIEMGDTRMFAAAPSSSKAPIYSLPSELEMVRFFVRLWIAKLSILWMRLHIRQWDVGIVQESLDAVIARGVPSKVAWLSPGRDDGFYADPFVITSDSGRVRILVENFRDSERKGEISLLTAEGGVLTGVESIIATSYHLAYPFVLVDQGDMYCLPESSASRGLTIYRKSRLDDQWLAINRILDGIAVVDPTLLRMNNNWWLFYTDLDLGATGNLCIHFSPTLEGEWKRHPLNPVKQDVRSSRPGGATFSKDGMIYRPAQDCSLTYGGALTINRIIEISETTFSEEPVALVSPDKSGPYPDGLHTLSCMGDTVVIDGQRFILSILRKNRLRQRE